MLDPKSWKMIYLRKSSINLHSRHRCHGCYCNPLHGQRKYKQNRGNPGNVDAYDLLLSRLHVNGTPRAILVHDHGSDRNIQEFRQLWRRIVNQNWSRPYLNPTSWYCVISVRQTVYVLKCLYHDSVKCFSTRQCQKCFSPRHCLKFFSPTTAERSVCKSWKLGYPSQSTLHFTRSCASRLSLGR